MNVVVASASFGGDFCTEFFAQCSNARSTPKNLSIAASKERLVMVIDRSSQAYGESRVTVGVALGGPRRAREREREALMAID